TPTEPGARPARGRRKRGTRGGRLRRGARGRGRSDRRTEENTATGVATMEETAEGLAAAPGAAESAPAAPAPARERGRAHREDRAERHERPEGRASRAERGHHGVEKSIVINAAPQETRLAILEKGLLAEIFVERESSRTVVGNIY